MEVALEALETIRAMAEIGQPSSASDAAVGALCARTAVLGAWLNVRTNAKDLADADLRAGYLERGADLAERARNLETEVLALVEKRL
jgi:glutamate formiminotransferase/formiminotetrahydrofolate cyclodeaminase